MASTKAFGKQIIVVLLSIILFIGFGCKPENIISEKEYSISISLESSLSDKQIADGTSLVFVEKGKTDSLRSYSVNGTTSFKLTAPENSTINFEIHIGETEGHNGDTGNFSTRGDKNINMVLEAKTHRTDIELTTEISGEPAAAIDYVLNPGNYTGTTNTEGKVTIGGFGFATNLYNEIEQTPITIGFSSNNIKDKAYERLLTTTENDFTFELTQQDYNMNLTIGITGNEKIVDLNQTGTNITLEYVNNEGTTKTITGNITNQNTANFNFITLKENIEGNIYTNVPRFEKDTIKNITITGTTTKSNIETILEPTTYFSTITFNTPTDKTTNEELTEATTTYEQQANEQTINTGIITGTTTITIKHETGTKNENIENKLVRTVINQGYNPYNETRTITEGENITINTELEKSNYNFVVKGTGNEGATPNIWKNGTTEGRTSTVTNGTYNIEWSNTTNPTFEADSITFTLEGYTKGWIGQTTIQNGIEKTINFELTPTQQENTYNITIETLDDKLENYITNGTIKIITQSDQDTTTTPIDTDGITNITIVGNYQPNENIKIEINNTTTHNNGTFALLRNGESAITGKIGSRITLNEYINHDLNTTIDEIDNPEGIYANMLSDESKNNTEIMESLNDPYTNRGIATWTPSTVTFINSTRDPATQEDLTQERIDRQQAALEFYNSRNTAGTGKILYNTNGITQTPTIPENPIGNIVMYRANGTGAGNGRLYTDPNHFTAVTAHTKDSDTPAKDIDEIGEGFGINDLSSGNNTFAFIYSGPGQISGLSDSGKTVWNTIWTYQPEDFKK